MSLIMVYIIFFINKSSKYHYRHLYQYFGDIISSLTTQHHTILCVISVLLLPVFLHWWMLFVINFSFYYKNNSFHVLLQKQLISLTITEHNSFHSFLYSLTLFTVLNICSWQQTFDKQQIWYWHFHCYLLPSSLSEPSFLWCV